MSLAADQEGTLRTVRVSDEVKVSIEAGDEVFLSARPLPLENLDAFIKRLTDDPENEEGDPGAELGLQAPSPGGLRAGSYRLLSDNYKKIAIEALFPRDRGDPKGWTHWIGASAGRPESLWRVAEWFTGDGANYREIRAGRRSRRSTEPGTGGSDPGPAPSVVLPDRGRRERPGDGGRARARVRAGRVWPVRALPSPRGRSALLGRRGPLHRARPRRGRQREGDRDRRAQRNRRRAGDPGRRPDQDPGRRPGRGVPAAGRSRPHRGGEVPPRSRPVRQSRPGGRSVRSHVRSRRGTRRTRYGRLRRRHGGGEARLRSGVPRRVARCASIRKRRSS